MFKNKPHMVIGVFTFHINFPTFYPYICLSSSHKIFTRKIYPTLFSTDQYLKICIKKGKEKLFLIVPKIPKKCIETITERLFESTSVTYQQNECMI